MKSADHDAAVVAGFVLFSLLLLLLLQGGRISSEVIVGNGYSSSSPSSLSQRSTISGGDDFGAPGEGGGLVKKDESFDWPVRSFFGFDDVSEVSARGRLRVCDGLADTWVGGGGGGEDSIGDWADDGDACGTCDDAGGGSIASMGGTSVAGTVAGSAAPRLVKKLDTSICFP